ncbi:hypothetical protein NDU88_006696 [Pleurodeles waltl]|uniref:Uncharacterized protein n=1 Tax=Pleurodeles waltl TaxID=8319 RepID=A0AAV7ULR7_PLEWA|nr:hypothetical protein NDU88_006696 [Pleurodeles waltl]
MVHHADTSLGTHQSTIAVCLGSGGGLVTRSLRLPVKRSGAGGEDSRAECSPRPGDLKVGAVPSPVLKIQLPAVQWAGDAEESLAGGGGLLVKWRARHGRAAAHCCGRAGEGPCAPAGVSCEGVLLRGRSAV